MPKQVILFSFNKKKAIGLLVFILGAVFLFPTLVLAQDLGIDYVDPLNLSNADPREAAVGVTALLMTFLGIIATIVIIYGGYVWTTSAGDPQKIEKAKKVITGGVIGLILVLSAFIIVNFVINMIGGALNNTGGSGGGGSGGGVGLGASGNRVIESHYPDRGQRGVPRNTMIAITFKEAIDPATIIEDANGNGVYGDFTDSDGDGVLDPGETYDKLPDTDSNILISQKNESLTGPYVTDIIASVSADNKTYRFKQVGPDFIGSPSVEIDYTVQITNGIRKMNGDRVWGVGDGYDWNFEVSTVIDTTPPRVKSIIPKPPATEPRNVVIQINFNEAIDPLTASGPVPGFSNILASTIAGNVEGNFFISNGYRTVEFLSEDACGENSCGDTVYCLPGDAILTVLAKAANLADPSEAAAIYPFDGIVDMVGNSFDGNKNKKAQGPSGTAYSENSPDQANQGDNYTWYFNTTGEIDLSAPKIESISPDSDSFNVDLNTVPTAVFNKILMSGSLIKNLPPDAPGSVALYADPPESEVFYSINKSNNFGTTTVLIKHHRFAEDTAYIPEFNSGIKDIYQNCYYPAAGADCTPDLNATPPLPYCCDGSQSEVSCKP